MSKQTVADQQLSAWGYYGWPGLTCRAVGEVRYVVGWMADQMTRLDWNVKINGSESWRVTTADGQTISTDEDPREASDALLKQIDWTAQTVRSVTTNLFVPGQGWYVTNGQEWSVVSTINPDRKKKLNAATAVVPFLWPHPADPTRPDSPLFGVIELLDELDWLQRQARTQSKQRVLISGIVSIADGIVSASGDDFWDDWNRSLSARMSDADDMSPIRLTGPAESIKDGVSWLAPPYAYDEVIDRRIIAAVQRLAYGLPIPPEILLGMQAQSRATAFQVEENAYRAHIEPPATMIADVAAQALALILDDGLDIQVEADPSRLLARRHSIQDVTEAFDRGAVTADYYREVLGIPESAAPGTVESTSGVSATETDPAEIARTEPVTASSTRTVDLTDLLASVDSSLLAGLAGAIAMATDRAHQRLGAAARSVETVRADPALKGLASARVAEALGLTGLQAAGVNVADQIAEPVDAATRWWVKRLGQAAKQLAAAVPGFVTQEAWVAASTSALTDSLAAHIISTLSDDREFDGGVLRTILNAASGGHGIR